MPTNIRLHSMFQNSSSYPLLAALVFIVLLLAGQAHSAEYPAAGSEIVSLQGAYNQVNNDDIIRTRNKIFTETFLCDRPVNITLDGGYSNTTYSTKNGFTRLHGMLAIRNGTLKVANFAIGGSAIGGISISNVAVTLPRITWNTNQPADSRVDYGETTSYGSNVSGTSLTTSHSLVLTGLKPLTTYHFIISSSTAESSAATADSTFTTPDFIAATIGDIGNSAIIEVSGNYDAKNGDGSPNTAPRQKVAQEYFRTHSDNIDFLVMLATFDYAMPDADSQGFYTPVRNDTMGINQAIFDNTAQYGSQSKLQGIIDMGNISELAVNPYGVKLDQTLTVLGHEMMHRFGPYIRYKKTDSSLSTNLLGKDDSHWSYLLDSQGSLMYGNGWQDNGDSSFTAISKQNAFSQLDLYLMGIIPKEQVPAMLLIDNPAIDKTLLPTLGATISGTATTVTIQNVIAAEGERLPNAATAQKQFNIGFVLLTRPGDNIGSASQAIDTLRNGFAGRFAELTQGIGSIANIPASLEVAINTPANGATISGPSVQVTGAIINTTGVETGVTVNGNPATVSGSQFVANNIELQTGENTITVIATDINGLTSTATRTVTSQAGNYIRLTSNIDSGIAPLALSFKIDAAFTVSAAQISFTGPVPVTITPGASAAEFTATLAFEGTYTFTATAQGPDGQTYSDILTITVLSKGQLDNLLKAKWEGIKSKFAQNDVEGAVSYLVSSKQSRYRDIFSGFGPRLPVLSEDMPTVQLANATDGRAKCLLIRQENVLGEQQMVAYPVYFVKENGIWKLIKY